MPLTEPPSGWGCLSPKLFLLACSGNLHGREVELEKVDLNALVTVLGLYFALAI